MAFNGNNMTPLGGNARAGENDQDRNAPMGWAYQSKTDDLADIQSAGYFDTFNAFLVAGQFIYVSLTDGKFIVTFSRLARILQQVTLDVAIIRPSGQEPIIITVTDTSNPETVTISSADILAELRFIVKDQSGGAGTNNITVETEGSEEIDNSTDDVFITVNNGVIRLYSDGSNLFSW